MDSFLFTVLSFVVALGILITVHEFGHFWVARTLGVKVLRFSVGFGKTLWRRVGKRDETEYVIAAIPLGGYVKMLDEREGDVDPGERDRSFNRQSLATRTAIVAAGPLFNFLFAIFAFWLIFVSGDTGTKPLVGVVKEDSIAHQAGFVSGQQIVAVGERETPTWETAVFAFVSEPEVGEKLAVKVLQQDGSEDTLGIPGSALIAVSEEGDFLERIGLSPRRPVIAPVIGKLISGAPAQQAGVRSLDRILEVDGEPVSTWSEFVTYIQAHGGKQVQLSLERDGATISLPVLVAQEMVNGELKGRIGAGVHVPPELFDEFRTEVRYGPVESIGYSLEKTWNMSLFMLKILGRMVTGEASVKNLSGPISIAQTAGKSASIGLVYFIKFLALISISLGVLNLLPIPILDGGHLAFFLIEAVRGKPLSEEAQLAGQKIGMILLLALMGLAFYVDLLRLLG